MALAFHTESWIWYTFAVGIIVARLISRTLLFRSPKGLQYDDWIMGLFVTTCYTVLVITSNIQARAQTNLLPPGFNTSTLESQDISSREYGSKIVIVVEQMQLAVIWSCKACLLIMYHRLTRMALNRENTAIKILALYITLGFILTEILYFTTWCRPFSSYWAVPTTNPQCTALTHHRILKAVFTITSELTLLSIALTIFIRSLLPLKRKLILCGIFSLGIFLVAATILNSYYSFTHPYRPTWVYWYIREASTAILVANLPFTWTLLRKVFHLGAFDEDHPPPATYHSSRTAGGRRKARMQVRDGQVEAGQPMGYSNGGGRSLVDSMFSHTHTQTKTCHQQSTHIKLNPHTQRTHGNEIALLPSVNEAAPTSLAYRTVSRPPPPLPLPSSPSLSPSQPANPLPNSTGGFHTNTSINPPITPPKLAKLPPPSTLSSSSAKSAARAVSGGRSAFDRRARQGGGRGGGGGGGGGGRNHEVG